jgi:hypothetical protein
MASRLAATRGPAALTVAWGPGAARILSGVFGAFAAVVLASGSATATSGNPASDAGAQAWRIAPAGPCARIDTTHPCSGGQCGDGDAAVRSRFDAADVASGDSGPGNGRAAPPEPIAFRGPGPCADPSTPCGQTPLGRIPSSQPPVGPPIGVVEQPANPGTLPGGLPGLP